jgi:hypothetical protein
VAPDDPRPRGRPITPADPMLDLGAALRAHRPPSPAEGEVIDHVHELARGFVVGTLPLAEGRRLCSGEERYLATRFTPPEHAAFRPLMALLDALIDDDGGHRTKHGLFLRDDLATAEAKIEREDGREQIVFPISYPWRIKPDAARHEPGVRDPAVYRTPDQRGPRDTTSEGAPRPRPEYAPSDPGPDVSPLRVVGSTDVWDEPEE